MTDWSKFPRNSPKEGTLVNNMELSQFLSPLFTLIITIYFEDCSMMSPSYGITTTTCHEVCRHIPSTKEAECRTLHLQRVPSSPGCTDMTSLDVKYNHITFLSTSDLQGYDQLTHLHLSHNIIFHIEEGFIISTPFLQYLDLSYNHIALLNSGIFLQVNQSQLLYLYLNNNLLSHIYDDSFQNITSLKSLILANNMITHLPSMAFHNLLNLEHLFLSNNKITQLSSTTFQNLSSLRELCLDYNLLQWLPEGLFTGLLSLEDLNLSHNELIIIPHPTNLLAVTWLHKMDISHNNLTQLHHIGVYFNMVTNLLIDDNPFSCDCGQYHMYKARTKYSLSFMCRPQQNKVNLVSYCESGQQHSLP